jgi:PilZ domain
VFSPRPRAVRLAKALIAAGIDPPAPDEQRTDWVRVRVRMGGSYRRLYPEGSRWLAYSTVDLSPGGAALECAGEPLQVGDVLLVRIDPRPEFGLEGLQLRAVVRNRRSNWSIYGIEWTRLTPEQQEELIRFTLQLEHARLDFERQNAGGANADPDAGVEAAGRVHRTPRRSFADA